MAWPATRSHRGTFRSNRELLRSLAQEDPLEMRKLMLSVPAGRGLRRAVLTAALGPAQNFFWVDEILPSRGWEV